MFHAVKGGQEEMARALLTWQAEFPFAEEDAWQTAAALAVDKCCTPRYKRSSDELPEDHEPVIVNGDCYSLAKLLLQEGRGQTL